MRSSDAWLGWVYDVHTFALLTTHLLLTLRFLDQARFARVQLGVLHLTAASQHLYERDRATAEKCLESEIPCPTYAALDPDEFTHPDQLAEHLWRVARREPTEHRWLTDVVKGDPR